MSNQTEQTPAPIDTATARTYTTVSRDTFIDLPDGTIAKLSTLTPDDRADVSICPTMDANGVAGWRIAWAMWDEGVNFDDCRTSPWSLLSMGSKSVWAEWRAWAAGEVYVVCSVDVDANSNELPDTAVSIGGIIGDDWAAECVQRAARYSAEGI